MVATSCLACLLFVGTASGFTSHLRPTHSTVAPAPLKARPRHHAVLAPRQLAPSAIDGLPLAAQQAAFAFYFAGLGTGSAALFKAYDSLDAALGPSWQRFWRTVHPLLGGLFLAAGSGHFTNAAAFQSIYPPQGTWGMWALPGSAEFHVAWTGVAEVLGGAGFLVGGLGSSGAPDALKPGLVRLASTSALALAALTLAVTPANIFMWTHGAMMVDPANADAAGSTLPVSFHYVRFFVQVAVLSILVSYGVGSGPVLDDRNT